SSGLRTASSNEIRGQTFTATASTPFLRTASICLYQAGFIGSGYTLHAELFATSAGLPTGAALAISTNSIDPSVLTLSTSGEWAHFNFDSVALTNAVQYAIVLVSDFPIDATNHVLVRTSSSNPYAGGAMIFYNGSVWGETGTHDCMFMISDAFVTTVGKA